MGKPMLIMLAAAGMAVGGCSTYGSNASLEDVGTGAAIGAAGGAAVGALVDGVSTVEGAAAGAAVGAVAGAVSSNNRRWYRDEYDRCYYINERGDRVYDNDRRC